MINVAIVGRRRDYHRGARVHIQAAADAQTHVCYEVHATWDLLYSVHALSEAERGDVIV